jgi:branched-chain amino acid aminotransferase
MGKYVDTESGLKVGFSSWRRIDDNMIPARAKVTGAYINSALAKTEAHHNGFDEAIFLNQNGHVSEGSAENLFLVRDGVLVTPMTTDNILEGITRASIVTLAEKELGLKVVSRSIDRTELYVADELFLCGTGAQIAWVKEIDHRRIGNGRKGEITAQLDKLYLEAVHGENPKYSSWLSPVYEKSLVNS